MTEDLEKKRFMIYEGIRRSGKTNMFNRDRVVELSEGQLTKSDVIYYMLNYRAMSKKYLGRMGNNE
jgi:hypothetical protein